MINLANSEYRARDNTFDRLLNASAVALDFAMRAAGSHIGQLLRRANAAGAIAVGRKGPMEGTSSREEIDRFLAAHP